MMLLSNAQGRTVVAVPTAERLGTVAALTLASSPPHVSAVRLKTRGRHDHVMAWSNVHSFGEDALTVRSAEVLRPENELGAEEEAHRSHDPLGKPVLVETGERMGTIEDLDFDERDGRLRALVTSEGEIPGDRLMGVGGYAVIVRRPE
ncbi:PRC-barrel domain-containing protein [Streptomyces sp. WMMC940]|uniref:PRC-barrel domain-containing protein n=1 Tax=Streptomyces sp. WMMC940 TaxID=3015153 RepID=UPI0022B64FE5|nr:PRC-barrel domain-containing protein [Streptomyces sp. WMMC940]MCZ7461940.1 PRC-barrel domain-containing protein [Streptomyces sp. WMMC940]